MPLRDAASDVANTLQRADESPAELLDNQCHTGILLGRRQDQDLPEIRRNAPYDDACRAEDSLNCLTLLPQIRILHLFRNLVPLLGESALKPVARHRFLRDTNT